jgi:hypothetical protein
MSEPEFLTVSQAAARLGVSERQARRYAGRLAPNDRRESGRMSGHDGHTSGHQTGMLVRLSAMQNEREKVTRRPQSDARPDMRPDIQQPMSGHEPDMSDIRPDACPDTQSDEVVALLKAENAFLRGMVEQHQRSEAELRAALRKALDAMPKALTSGSTPNATPDEAATRENAPQAPVTTNASQADAAPKQSTQRGRKPREMTAWQRIAARVLGIR